MTAGTDRYRPLVRFLLSTVIMLLPLACKGGGSGGGGGGGGAVGMDFSQGLAAFQEATDPDEQRMLFEGAWRTMTESSCWDGAYSIRVGDTPIGSVAQYSFYQPFNYRYVSGGASGASDIWSGRMGFYAVGTYHGLPAIVLTTWMDQSELIVFLTNGVMAHVWWTDSGYPVALYFNPSERCQ